ncbi:MAG: HD-GYP domain-containing protein, partial [Bacillota bacterium]
VERSQTGNSAYQANYMTIFALTAAIDAKDHYTYQHSRNVALYSAMLATAAGLNDEQISVIYEAGLLHDIGKISIAETILGKTSRLSDEEYEMMKGHVNSSMDMIRYLPAMDYVIPAAVDHHERWDGKGYPRGISGRDITVGGRCLALADAFDAMTTDRPYRKGMPVENAAIEIEKDAGTHFDPDLARLFVSIIRSGEITPVL